MLFYNIMQNHVVRKSKICELLGHNRRGPKKGFLPTHYSLPRYLLLKRIPGLENVRVWRTYIEIDVMQLVLSHCPWFNAFMSLSVGSSFVKITGLCMLDP